MKTKQFFYLALLIFMSFSFTSCGSDNDDGPTNHNAELLKGDTWVFEKASVTVMGQTIDMSYNEIRQLIAQESGTNNVILIDEKLRFTDDKMIFVNTGDEVRYNYYNNGTFTFDGMEAMKKEGIDMTMRIKTLTEHQLVFTARLKVEGMTMDEDLYYKR